MNEGPLKYKEMLCLLYIKKKNQTSIFLVKKNKKNKFKPPQTKPRQPKNPQNFLVLTNSLSTFLKQMVTLVENLSWFYSGGKKQKASEEADAVSYLLKDMFRFKCKNDVIDFDIKASHWIASKC